MKDMERFNEVKLISGNAHPELSKEIASKMGIKLMEADVGRFADGETKVQIHEDVRGKDIFILQPTCPPVNENFMELLIMCDALKRASAGRITAVMPYYGYARQDRKHEGRVPITAKLAANLLTTAGVNRVLCMDLHAAQIQGFFDVPLDHITSLPALLGYIKTLNLENICVLSPDAGRMKLSEKIANKLNGSLALIDKCRKSDTEVTCNAIMGDIKGKTVLIADDMISTAGTISQAVHVALEHGAKDVFLMCTHPVFCGRAFERLSGLPVKQLIVCNTLPVKEPKNIKIVTVSVADLISKAITNIHESKSLSKMFEF